MHVINVDFVQIIVLFLYFVLFFIIRSDNINMLIYKHVRQNVRQNEK